MVYHGLLNKYYKTLIRYTEPISCPLCNRFTLPIKYEKHCFDQHNLQPKTQCVWCQGRFRWPAKKKSQPTNADHLLECFERFMRPSIPHDIPVEERPMPATYTLFNMNHLYPVKDFMGHLQISSERSYRFMESIDVKPYPLTVDDPNADLAVAWVHHYIETREKNDFFHIMIRKVAIPSFKSAMKKNPQVYILPFACWCDGGRYEYQPRYRQHAHMIACAPKGYFKANVWAKIGTSDRPKKNYQCMHDEKIISKMHFVNVMGYVCKPDSRCNFGRKGKQKLPNHFYLNKTLPVDFQLILVLQWDGGLLEYIHEKYKNMEPSKLALLPIQSMEGRWKIKIGDLGIFHDRITPVSKNFIPASGPTEYYWHLIEGKEMYFEKLETSLPDPEWIHRQQTGGNLLCHAVANEWWTPKAHLQRALNSIYKVVRSKNSKIVELEQKLQLKDMELEQKLQSKDMEVEQKLQSKDMELEQKLQSKDMELEQKLQSKDMELEQKLQLKDMKIDELEQKLQLKNMKIDELETIVYTLKRKREMDDEDEYF